jgi:spore germination protein YaaH
LAAVSRLAAAAALAAPLCATAALVCALAGMPAYASAGVRPSGTALQAFVLASAPDSLADLEAHASSVGVVYPTYFTCELGSGLVTGAADEATNAFARARGMTLMPRFTCQEGTTVHRILTDRRVRARTLARLAAIAGQASYEGLCLDLENDGAGDRDALSSFTAALARRLHARGRRLTVVVDGVSTETPRHGAGQPATRFYDDRALSAAADTIFVLAWGAHWSGSGPGPIAPLSYVRRVARFVAALPHASRFVLGAPMYGIDWTDGGGRAAPGRAYEYSDVLALARTVGATPVRDPAADELTFSYRAAAGASHHVWFLDGRAIADRLAIGRAHGLAVGVWRLGREDPALWSLAPIAPRPS